MTPDGPKLHSIIVDPRDTGHLYFAMSGGGVHESRNGGDTWERLDAGLPREQAWWTVKRQAMAADAANPLGLYFGTTGSELWMSREEGRRWTCMARHLPEIYAVEAGEPA